jgi:hypothetical protein
MSVHDADTSDVERLRRAVGRVGFVIAVSSLVAAIVLFSLGHRAPSAHLFLFAFGVLLAMPVKNVIAVLADEVLRRDWWFGLLAVTVLTELALSAFDRLR